MPNRAFLDSNVFIFAFERPGSNSEKIVSWLVNGELTGTVTDRVVREVMGYFRRYYGKDLAAKFRDIILLTCEFILEEDLTIPQTFVDQVGEKDAGAVAAVRDRGLSCLVSTDSDFEGLPEHRTPRAFVQERAGRARPGEE